MAVSKDEENQTHLFIVLYIHGTLPLLSAPYVTLSLIERLTELAGVRDTVPASVSRQSWNADQVTLLKRLHVCGVRRRVVFAVPSRFPSRSGLWLLLQGPRRSLCAGVRLQRACYSEDGA